jgi:histone deacetylase complex subunit SAP18
MSNSDKQLDINREKICPFLLRVFYKENDFNNLDSLNNNELPSDRELHIYTWIDATLRELTMLIKDAIDCIKRKDTVLAFSIIYSDSKGKLQRKEVGNVNITRKGPDDNKTLQELRLTIGDYIDINIKN